MAKRHPGYEYQRVNITLTHYDALGERTTPTIEDADNHWAVNGWRTVSVIPPRGEGYAYSLLLERVKENPHNKKGDYKENQRWHDWVTKYGEEGEWG